MLKYFFCMTHSTHVWYNYLDLAAKKSSKFRRIYREIFYGWHSKFGDTKNQLEMMHFFSRKPYLVVLCSYHPYLDCKMWRTSIRDPGILAPMWAITASRAVVNFLKTRSTTRSPRHSMWSLHCTQSSSPISIFQRPENGIQIQLGSCGPFFDLVWMTAPGGSW